MTTAGLIIAAVRSVVAYVIVGLYILLIGLPALVVAVIGRSPSPLYWAGYVGVRLGLAIPGIRFRVAGSEHIGTAAAVYCANHTSNLEPPILFASLRRLFPRIRILYKAGLRQIPVLGRGFDLAGFVPIERGNRDQSSLAIDRAAAAILQGFSFLIFPEGTRSRTDQLLPFKKGGFIMALKAQAPIVPIALSGARAAMRRGSAVVRPVVVSVRFGPPIATAGRDLSHRDALIAEVRGAIERMLAQGPVT